eukprot:9113884-Alexandrium_andersonii.AAC.1
MSQALELVEPGHERRVDVGLHGTKVNLVPNIFREGLDTKYSVGKEKRAHIHLVPKLRRDLSQQPGLRPGSTAVVA